MGTILFYAGLFLYLAGSRRLVVVGLRESLLWGFGSLFLPIVGAVFAAMQWEQAKRSLLTLVAGLAILVLIVFLAPTPSPAANQGVRRAARASTWTSTSTPATARRAASIAAWIP